MAFTRLSAALLALLVLTPACGATVSSREQTDAGPAPASQTDAAGVDSRVDAAKPLGLFTSCGVLGLGTINSAALSRDGSFIAVASDDGVATLLRAFDGAPVRSIPVGRASLNSIAISPDGSLVATAGGDGAVGVFASSNGADVHSFTTSAPEGGGLLSVAISPDGTSVAAAGPSNAWLWRLADGSLSWEKNAVNVNPWESTRVLGFSPDGTLLAVAASVLRVSDGSVFLPLPEATAVSAVAFSPDGTALATLGAGHTNLTAWNLSDGTPLLTMLAELESDYFEAMAFSPDGSTLALATEVAPGGIELLGVHDASGWVSSPAITSTMAADGSYAVDLAYTSDGSGLLVAPGDTSLEIVNVASGMLRMGVAGVGGGTTSIDFSPDGTLLLAGSINAGEANLWDLGTQGLRTSFGAGGAATFSPDGASMALASPSGISFDRVSDEEPVSSFETLRFPLLLGYASDGNTIFANLGGNISSFTVAGGMSQAELSFSGTVWGFALSPDGTKLASLFAGSDDGSVVEVTNLATGAHVSRSVGWHPVGNPFPASAPAFSPDGSMLAIPPELLGQEAATLVSADTLKDVRTLQAGGSGGPFLLAAVAWSGDDVAVAEYNQGELRVYRASDGALVQTLETVLPGATLAFSADGSKLAMAMPDEAIRLFCR